MKKTKIKSRTEFAVVTAAVIAVVALINYASNSVFFRVDLTEDRQFTVSDATRRVLRDLDDIVNVKVFFSKNLPPETHTTVNTVRDLLSEYQNIARGRLRVTWEDPANDQEAAASARNLGVPEITLQTIKRDKAESMRAYMGIGIMYADRSEAIPIVRDLTTLEYDLTMAIIRVKRGDAIPKIGIVKSQSADFIPPQVRQQMNMNDETTERRFAPIFDFFRDEYRIVTVDLSEGKPIDSDIRTLIVPGGDRFPDRALFEIDQYFMNGGNLLLMANGVNVTFARGGPQGYESNSRLLELIEHYGVRVEKNLIMDASCGHVQVPRNIGMFTINELMAYPFFVRIVEGGFSRDNPAVSGQSELMLGWASSLTLVPDTAGLHTNVSAATLVSSSAQSWEVRGHFNLSPQTEYQMPPPELMGPRAMVKHLSGDFKSFFDGKPVPPVQEEAPDEDDEVGNLNRINLFGEDRDRVVTPSNTGGNLIIAGDVNFITSNNTSRPNLMFMLNLVDWLSLDNNLIAIRSRTMRDKTINPNVLEPGSSTPGLIRWINLLLMPIIVAIVGIVISLKRRERVAPSAAPAEGTGGGDTDGSDNADSGDAAIRFSALKDVIAGNDNVDSGNAAVSNNDNGSKQNE
jgi:gliding-associated putative ABC transporter substrate-binding component GldG